MGRHKGLTAALAIAVMALGLAGPASADTVDFGIQGSPMSGGPALGGGVTRINIDWCKWQPQDPNGNPAPGHGGYSPIEFVNRVETPLENAVAKGYDKVVVDLRTAAPEWARDAADQNSNGQPCGPVPIGGDNYGSGYAAIGSSHASDYGLAAKALVQCIADSGQCPVADSTYFDDRQYVYGIELGNEVNTDIYWQNHNDTITASDAGRYATAAESAATQIQGFDPSIKVATAGLSYGTPDGNAFSSSTVDGTTYLGGMLLSGNLNMNDIDAVAYHPYGPGLHMSFTGDTEDHITTDTSAIVSKLAQFSIYSKPLWMTEVGDDADGDHCYGCQDNGFVSDAEANQQDVELTMAYTTIKGLCADSNIDLALFWSYYDINTPHWFAGFKDAAGNARPVYTDWSNDPGGLLSHNTCN